MERWGRACTLVGYGTAWIAPNPLSAIAMALGNSARWTMIAHHVMHRGYDRVPGTPARLKTSSSPSGLRISRDGGVIPMAIERSSRAVR
jgi:hypothetical protein